MQRLGLVLRLPRRCLEHSTWHAPLEAGGSGCTPPAAPQERAAGGAAWFRFEELCARPLGAADYLAVAQAFHTVFLEGVPAMGMQARRGGMGCWLSVEGLPAEALHVGLVLLCARHLPKWESCGGWRQTTAAVAAAAVGGGGGGGHTPPCSKPPGRPTGQQCQLQP